MISTLVHLLRSPETRHTELNDDHADHRVVLHPPHPRHHHYHQHGHQHSHSWCTLKLPLPIPPSLVRLGREKRRLVNTTAPALPTPTAVHRSIFTTAGVQRLVNFPAAELAEGRTSVEAQANPALRQSSLQPSPSPPPLPIELPPELWLEIIDRLVDSIHSQRSKTLKDDTVPGQSRDDRASIDGDGDAARVRALLPPLRRVSKTFCALVTPLAMRRIRRTEATSLRLDRLPASDAWKHVR